MTFKQSAVFYTIVYCVFAAVLLYADKAMELGFANSAMIVLPILLAVSLGLNFYLFRATQGRPAGFVNALMLTSMGRLVGFATVLVVTVFANKATIVPSAVTVSILYLVSTGADAYFAKRFK